VAQVSDHPLRFAVFEGPFHHHPNLVYRRKNRWGRADPPNRRRSPQEPHTSPRGSKLEIDKIIWMRDTPNTDNKPIGQTTARTLGGSRYPCWRFRPAQSIPQMCEFTSAQDDPLTEDLGDELCTRTRGGLYHRVAYMGANCLMCYPQRVGDLWPGVPKRYEPYY
jgi:hypothetical protein